MGIKSFVDKFINRNIHLTYSFNNCNNSYKMKPLDFIIRDCEVCEAPRYFKWRGNDGVPWRQKHYYNCMECSHQIKLYEDEFTDSDRRNAKR